METNEFSHRNVIQFFELLPSYMPNIIIIKSFLMLRWQFEYPLLQFCWKQRIGNHVTCKKTCLSHLRVSQSSHTEKCSFLLWSPLVHQVWKGMPCHRCLFRKITSRNESKENWGSGNRVSSNSRDSQPLLSTPEVWYSNFMTKTENLFEGQNLNFDSFAGNELRNR